jgi:hypothetical protein
MLATSPAQYSPKPSLPSAEPAETNIFSLNAGTSLKQIQGLASQLWTWMMQNETPFETDASH